MSKLTKKEAADVVKSTLGRHKSPEHFVSDALEKGEMSLTDLAWVFITCYRNFHPKLLK